MEDPGLFERFAEAAAQADFKIMHDLVRAGFDLRSLDEKWDDTLLCRMIRQFSWEKQPHKYEVVSELLRMGACASQLAYDGSGPLFTAILDRDAEMVRILLEHGADPNLERMDTDCESLYDWADFDYRYEIWNLNIPEDTPEAAKASEDAWLSWLEEMAAKYDKQPPTHLRLLRERGALTLQELRELGIAYPKRGGLEGPLRKFELRMTPSEEEILRDARHEIALGAQIWIDGKHLDEPHAVDLVEVVRSLRMNSWHDIFTCGCGIAGCAGIYDGVMVAQSKDRVSWRLRRPQSMTGLSNEQWNTAARYEEYIFEREQMIEAIRVFVRRLRAVVADYPGRFTWSVFDLQLQDILELDPRNPRGKWDSLGWQRVWE